MDNKQKFELNYLVIPAKVYKDNRLTFISLKVYGFIHAYTNPFYFSNEHVAEMFDCSSQSISDSIQLLKKLGYIDTIYKMKAGGGKTRLTVDLYSNYNSSYSGDENAEATTTTPVIDKVYKDNNIKEKILENDPLQERQLGRQRAAERRGRRLGAAKINTLQHYTSYEKKVKSGTHAEDII